MALAHHVTPVNQATRERCHAAGGEAEAVPQRTGREATERVEMLERGELDLGDAEAAGASRAVMAARELEAVEGRGGLSYWLCTHWPTSPEDAPRDSGGASSPRTSGDIAKRRS